MKLVEVTIHELVMRMKTPFTTSLGTMQDKRFLVVEAKDESGVVGWGEGLHLKSLPIQKKHLKLHFIYWRIF